MVQSFGDQYEEYRRTTGALFAEISQLASPSSHGTIRVGFQLDGTVAQSPGQEAVRGILRSCQIRLLDTSYLLPIDTAEVGISQVSGIEAGVCEIGVSEIRSAKICVSEVGRNQRRALEVAVSKVCSVQ